MQHIHTTPEPLSTASTDLTDATLSSLSKLNVRSNSEESSSLSSANTSLSKPDTASCLELSEATEKIAELEEKQRQKNKKKVHFALQLESLISFQSYEEECLTTDEATEEEQRASSQEKESKKITSLSEHTHHSPYIINLTDQEQEAIGLASNLYALRKNLESCYGPSVKKRLAIPYCMMMKQSYCLAETLSETEKRKLSKIYLAPSDIINQLLSEIESIQKNIDFVSHSLDKETLLDQKTHSFYMSYIKSEVQDSKRTFKKLKQEGNQLIKKRKQAMVSYTDFKENVLEAVFDQQQDEERHTHRQDLSDPSEEKNTKESIIKSAEEKIKELQISADTYKSTIILLKSLASLQQREHDHKSQMKDTSALTSYIDQCKDSMTSRQVKDTEIVDTWYQHFLDSEKIIITNCTDNIRELQRTLHHHFYTHLEKLEEYILTQKENWARTQSHIKHLNQFTIREYGYSRTQELKKITLLEAQLKKYRFSKNRCEEVQAALGLFEEQIEGFNLCYQEAQLVQKDINQLLKKYEEKISVLLSFLKKSKPL